MENNIDKDIEILKEVQKIFEHLKNHGWINDIERDVDTDKVIQVISRTIEYVNYAEQTKIACCTAQNCEALNNAIRLGKELETYKKKYAKAIIYEKLYEDLSKDFEDYKNDKDINYLDGIHHKKLVEKSIGQIIKEPEECWFDIFEVKVIKNEMLYGIGLDEDFVNLKQISDTDPENCITVIAESPLSGVIYRYNNNGNKEWQLIGTMLGYS